MLLSQVPSFLCGSQRFYPRRARRGAALLVTVLLAALAASIVLVLLTQSLNISRNESARSSSDNATQAIEEAKVDFEKDLGDDPLVFLHKVRSDEKARFCPALVGAPKPGGSGQTYGANDPALTIRPGSPWPKECGGVWEYKTPAPDQEVTLSITPPSPDRPLLTASILGKSGSAVVGKVVDYRINGAGRFSVWSQSDLSLDSLSNGGGATSLSGSIYSAGTVYLPTSENVQISSAQIMTEAAEFAGTPSGGNVRFYAKNERPNDPTPIQDIRTVVPGKLSSAGLASSASSIKDVACLPRSTNQSRKNPGDPQPYSTGLCLKEGSDLIRTDGTRTGALPAAKAYLFLTGESGVPGTVNVYSSLTEPAYTGECMVRCSLTTLARLEVAAKTHPGDRSYWTNFLGTFALPASGAVFADADTFVGLCGGAFLNAGTNCATVSGNVPGMAVQKSLTLAVGTTDQPHSVYVSGPINKVADARLGILATKDVVFPYWARPAKAPLNVDAALVALGLGSVATSPIHTLPERAAPSAGESDENYGTTLTLTGSLAAPKVSLDLGIFNEVALKNDTALLRTPPPYFPGFTGNWEESQAKRMTVAEIAAFQAN